MKAPKVYLGDAGILHYLLDIRDREQLDNHPKVGASWEGFALHETVQRLGAQPDECYFWATHAGALKRTDAPTFTPSMHHALHDLNLDRLWVVHAGRDEIPLGPRVEAIGLDDLIRKKTLG